MVVGYAMRRLPKPLPRNANQRNAEFLKLAIEEHLKPITAYLAFVDRKKNPSPKRRK
jgi:hypothetical protein